MVNDALIYENRMDDFEFGDTLKTYMKFSLQENTLTTSEKQWTIAKINTNAVKQLVLFNINKFFHT